MLARRLSALTPAPQAQIRIPAPFESFYSFSDKEFLIQEYVKNQKPAAQITKECGCSHSTVLGHLKRHGIPIRNQNPPTYLKGHLPYGKKLVKGMMKENKADVDQILKMKNLRDEGYSYRGIAKVFNSMGIPSKSKKAPWHATTVMKILKKSAGLKTSAR